MKFLIVCLLVLLIVFNYISSSKLKNTQLFNVIQQTLNSLKDQTQISPKVPSGNSLFNNFPQQTFDVNKNKILKKYFECYIYLFFN
jgi:hypothetical protein